ncbi:MULTISPECIES: Fe(3+)-pyochelin receptor FptA [Pseudomonas]|jgi:outer membrane receptor for ferric coprogen and ferric-rhodotorulic acid|uniref:TonB-dependent siderophore receptor n=4 Tax=Pseudomonas aeruginosa TaxID=287 RepID=A0A211UXB2_PSEAI|nr:MULTISPECIES: Fe(3+)-pyochelin receptor FptA [Pseudomonas]EAZ60340.1 Fe(III)-pyochelin outer membrane receptor precursor [Pseudomonas aeruginosa 2192]ETU90190.1 Fe(3+)-pyochelin receptor [Pseudomonas aeruginosa BWHPSA048]KEA14865.1 amino acid ABC transporter substrate-binding protein [Pseudomonas aeruginosa C2773C]KEA18482.1 amino acid ABC transporter substrate-binding protein [Pseudomonas aeruginosa C2159M]KFB17336.1 amino acid ABC transporter substrate-binding protein [Pseudomonas aerugin
MKTETKVIKGRQGIARNRHTPLCLGLLLALSPLAAAVADARKDGETELPDMVISGESTSATQPPGVTTLGKVPLKPRELPQSASVIDHERLEQQNLFSLDEAMQQATGVTVQPFQLLTTAYYVRGFKVDSFELDGVPALLGNTASSPQDMAIYERVEILRGSNGLLHGTGNPAATVNLVRKRPQREFAASTTLSAGRWDRYRAEVDVGGPLSASGNVRGRAVAAYEDRDYFYDVADQGTRLLYGVTEFDLSPDTLLTVGAQYQHIDSITNMAGVPMAKDGSNLGLSRDTYLDVDWDRFKWDTYRAFGSLEQQLGGGWKGKVSAEYQEADSRLRYAGSFGAIDPQTGDGGQLTGAAYKFKSIQRSLDANLNGPVRLFGLTHELLGGVTYAQGETRQDTARFLNLPNTPVNVYRWDPHGVPRPQIGQYTSPGTTTTTQKGLYALGRIKLAEPLTLVVGGRESWWDQDTPATRFKPGRQFTPYGGLIWDFARDWSWYVSYAEVYQPQADRQTWNSEPLSPVEGKTYETGIKGELADGRLNLSLAAFRIDLENNPQEDPDHPGPPNNPFYISGGKVRSQGFELEGTGYLTPYWSLSAGYTYTSTEYLKDSQNDSGTRYSTFTPRHLLRLWSNYDLPWQDRRWSVGGGLQAQSDYSVDYRGVSMRQGGYALVNMRLGYKIDEHWTAAVNVNNLFDRTYYQSLSNPNWNNRYGEPRSFNVSLRGAF